jgi:hypothetical protein
MATVFEPIRPVPPMTTIFIVTPACRRLKAASCRKISVGSRSDVNTEAVGLVQLKTASLGVFAVHAAGTYRDKRRRRDAETVRAILVTPMSGLASIAR